MPTDARREDRGGVVVTLPPATEPWLDTPQAMAYTRVGRTKLYAACQAEHLRHVRVGLSYRFRRVWLDQWLEAGAQSTVAITRRLA